MGSAADRVYRRLEPFAFGDADHGYALQKLVQALTVNRELFEVARDADGYIAWGKVLDPDACPVELLDWLAVQAGVDLPPFTLTEADKRARIKQAAGQYRGTNRAIVEEVQPTLTGTKYVSLLEQVGGDPWAVTMVTLTAETPSPSVTLAAALRQKRAGIALTHVVTTDPLIDQGTRAIDSGTAVIDTAVLADIV